MYFWKYFWMYFFVWKYFFLFGYITIALVTARCGFPCAKTDSLICGHDNKTYQGECVMRRESCWRREAIVKAYNGKCKTGTWIFWVESVEIQSFFWSVFSSNWTEYGNLLCKYLYSVQIQENMDEKKTTSLDTFYAVNILSLLYDSVTDKKVLLFKNFGWFCGLEIFNCLLS